ncbi:MAG TPA: pyridoxamine 5'-phosphate oxidase family protein [Acidimicrobiia bacterium]|nr:pyridoxamine 5'-phosphate oxidase family protein [Acidimicrobiia bacterium]
MSIPVELEEVRGVAAQQAEFAYLLTVSDDGSPHAVAITPVVGESSISCPAGRRSCANALARDNVSLLWPPDRPGDYSLIVDGRARVDGTTVHIVPERAVRHRPAAGGGSDCAPVALHKDT